MELRREVWWILALAIGSGCSSAFPAPNESLVPESEHEREVVATGPWQELVGECALTEGGRVYCLDHDAPTNETTFYEVPALQGAQHLVDDAGCVYAATGQLECVSLPTGTPRGSFVADPSRLDGVFVEVVDGCVIDRNSVRRCDFGDFVPLDDAGWPDVPNAIGLDVLEVEELLIVATLQDDGNIVYDIFDFEEGELSRWTEQVDGAVAVHLGRFEDCVLAGPSSSRRQLRCADSVARAKHPLARAWWNVRFPLPSIAGIGGITKCAITEGHGLRCRLRDRVGPPPGQPVESDEVLAVDVAEISLGDRHLCIRSSGGVLACDDAHAVSEAFGEGWREITP